MIDFWKLFWLVLPGGVANMVPPFAARWWPRWSRPMDGGAKMWGKRVLGDHKTIRGMVSGTIVAQLVYMLVPKYYPHLPWYFGFILGVGALGGDAIKSFFKRQAGVESGKSWFPWDQIDWIVGIIVMTSFWQIFSLMEIVVLITVGLGLHLLFKIIGYYLNVNEGKI
jgi:CDP-2,3-bis-(O-geranylgeranyl)-sn-glycerol synthase